MKRIASILVLLATVPTLQAFAREVPMGHSRSSLSSISGSSNDRAPVSVTRLDVEISPDGKKVLMVVRGLTASGRRTSLSQALPSAFQMEPDFHHRWVSNPGRGLWDECRRILNRNGAVPHVVGSLVRTVDRSGKVVRSEGVLGFSWGFDLATRKFWYKYNAAEAPVLPKPFRGENWTGINFRAPLQLVRYDLEEVESIVENWGGTIAGPEGPVDVVILPDSVDFCPTATGSRESEAEKWLRKGARVMWERNFPKPSPTKPGDDEWRD